MGFYLRSMEHSGGRTAVQTPTDAPRQTVLPTIHMILHVWGETATDQERAERAAARGWARSHWEFVNVKRFGGPSCPLDLKDSRSVAADQGYGWAYVAYPAKVG